MSPSVRTGTLRETIRIERRTTARDEAGDATETWFELLRLRASVTPERASERLRAGRDVGEVGYAIVSHPAGQELTAADRIVWERPTAGDRVLSIEAVTEEDRSLTISALYRMPTTDAAGEIAADEAAP